jgi:molybdopterin-guanine dinucleotide biosynthesis protein MobB
MNIIAVIGSKKSGKTTTIEALVRGLTKRGYRVATVKHVSEKGFTLDTEGKDTWRHAQAGAKTIVVVAPNELGIIKKVDTTKQGLQEIVKHCENNVDFTILEGFRSLVEKEPNVPKIVAVKAYDEAVETLKRFKPIIAFTGSAAFTAKKLGIPVVDVLEEPENLVEIVERKIGL